MLSEKHKTCRLNAGNEPRTHRLPQYAIIQILPMNGVLHPVNTRRPWSLHSGASLWPGWELYLFCEILRRSAQDWHLAQRGAVFKESLPEGIPPARVPMPCTKCWFNQSKNSRQSENSTSANGTAWNLAPTSSLCSLWCRFYREQWEILCDIYNCFFFFSKLSIQEPPPYVNVITKMWHHTSYSNIFEHSLPNQTRLIFQGKPVVMSWNKSEAPSTGLRNNGTKPTR